MSLPDLPVELLTLINKLIIADDVAIRSFESLALTCHALYTASHSLFEEYKLTRDFRQFNFRKGIRSSRGRAIREPCELIYELATHPRTAEVIRVADLRWVERESSRDDETEPGEGELRAKPEESQKEYWDELRSIVGKLLTDSPYAVGLDLDADAWLTALYESDRKWRTEHAWDMQVIWGTALLLTMLPNVEMLACSTSLKDENDTESGPWKLIKVLVRNANIAASTESAPLSKLKEILPEYGGGYDTRTRLTFHQLFLGLKNLEVFTQGSAVAYNDGYTGTGLTLAMDDFPGVKELDLTDSIMGGNEIYELTSRMPKLEIFSLEQTVKWHGCGYSDWDPKQFVESLASAVGTQLRSLSIIIANDDLGGTESMIDVFTGFTRLEELQFDLDLLEDHNELKNSVKQLQDRLPRSLRRLRLVGEEVIRHHDGPAWMGRLFEGWNENIDSVTPDLEVVEILNMRKLTRDEMFAALEGKVQRLRKVKLVEKPGWEPMTFGTKWPEWFEVHDE